MALKKDIKTSSNATASYWNIVRVHANRITKTIEVFLNGYVDEATRRAVDGDGKPVFTPLDSGMQTILPDAYEQLTSEGTKLPSYGELYDYLMQSPSWADAEKA